MSHLNNLRQLKDAATSVERVIERQQQMLAAIAATVPQRPFGPPPPRVPRKLSRPRRPASESGALSVRDVAERLGLSEGQILALIRSGDLPASNVTKKGARKPRWRISAADLEAFLNRRRTVPAPKPQPRRKRPERVTEYF